MRTFFFGLFFLYPSFSDEETFFLQAFRALRVPHASPPSIGPRVCSDFFSFPQSPLRRSKVYLLPDISLLYRDFSFFSSSFLPHAEELASSFSGFPLLLSREPVSGSLPPPPPTDTSPIDGEPLKLLLRYLHVLRIPYFSPH